MPSHTDFEFVVPTFTPFDASAALDLSVVPTYADYLDRVGIKGVFVNGTTGESASLTVDEAKATIDAWCGQKKRYPGLRVIAHVGHASVFEAKSLAKHAGECRADAIAAAPPYYFRPESVNNLVNVMAEIANSVSLPFYYYHIPSMTGVDLPMVKFLAGAKAHIGTFSGLKFTHEDLSEFGLCLDAADHDCDVFFGRDEMLLGAVAMGARGAVGTTYNVMPQLYRDMLEAYQKGDFPQAQQLQLEASKIVDIAKDFGALPAFKAMMGLKGVDCGPCRMPLEHLGGLEITTLRDKLSATAFDFGLVPR